MPSSTHRLIRGSRRRFRSLTRPRLAFSTTTSWSGSRAYHMTVSWGVPEALIVPITAKHGCSRNARTSSAINTHLLHHASYSMATSGLTGSMNPGTDQQRQVLPKRRLHPGRAHLGSPLPRALDGHTNDGAGAGSPRFLDPE